MSNTSNGTASDSGSEPVLSPEAIANITASAVGLIVISSVLCYLLLFFNKQERQERIRMALERNRQIEKQMAAAKARQEQEKLKSQQLSPEREELLFSQVHRSHELLHDGPENQGEHSLIIGGARLLGTNGSPPPAAGLLTVSVEVHGEDTEVTAPGEVHVATSAAVTESGEITDSAVSGTSPVSGEDIVPVTPKEVTFVQPVLIGDT